MQLLEHGADVNYSNNHHVVSAWRSNELASRKNCGTALHEAAKRGHHRIADMLLQYGAEPWATNRYERG